MKLVTFCNRNHPGLKNLEASCSSVTFGWELIIVGKDTIWKGFRSKMEGYLAECRKLDANEVIVVCDAFDVLCLRSSDEFLSKFESFNADIVWGAESVGLTADSLDVYWNRHGKSKVRPALNSGLLAGRAGAIVTLWETALEANEVDDQIAAYRYTNGHSEICRLDVNCCLFYNDNWGTSKFSISPDPMHELHLIKENLNIAPYFIHFPGLMTLSSVSLLDYIYGVRPCFPGDNYIKVGKAVSGYKHLCELPPDWRLYKKTLWIERACYLTIILFLIYRLKTR